MKLEIGDEAYIPETFWDECEGTIVDKKTIDGETFYTIVDDAGYRHTAAEHLIYRKV